MNNKSRGYVAALIVGFMCIILLVSVALVAIGSSDQRDGIDESVLDHPKSDTGKWMNIDTVEFKHVYSREIDTVPEVDTTKFILEHSKIK